MAAAAADAEAAAGGVDMAEADGAEQMDTSDPLAYELSATLRAIAGLLQLDASGPSAAAMVAAVQARVAQLLAQLPAGFFEPLLPAGALGEAQVRELAQQLALGLGVPAVTHTHTPHHAHGRPAARASPARPPSPCSTPLPPASTAVQAI